MNNLLALTAFVVLVGFLGILVMHVPRLDLIGVITVTLILAGWDLYQGLRGNKG
jgi:divalent metal cation (Fe/Co/Zn/Cd) transporter